MSIVSPADVPMDLDSDLFMRTLLRELMGLLQDVVGLEEAEGFIASVGTSVGAWLEQKYREGMGPDDLEPRQIAEVFCDLKQRINGDFHVIEVDDTKIVVGNRACPFGKMAEGRDALCMMTSSVFGRIAADHMGYARVELKETIARGDAGCRIVVHLVPGASDGAQHPYEYYRSRPLNGSVAAE